MVEGGEIIKSNRFHRLPSDDEIAQSHELIKNLTQELFVLFDRLADEEPASSDSSDEGEWHEQESRRRMKILGSNRVATLYITPTREQIYIKQKQIQEEMAFIAPIRKLPVELILSIVHEARNDNSFAGHPTLMLSSVCKTWRNTINSHTAFWTDVKIFPSWMRELPPMNLWESRLELLLSRTGDSLIDVEWAMPCHVELDILTRLLQILVKMAPFSRWRSLCCSNRAFESAEIGEKLEGLLIGQFTNLQSLVIEGMRQYHPLFDVIANTAVCLKTLKVNMMWQPSNLNKTDGFGACLTSITAPPKYFQLYSIPDSLEEISIPYGTRHSLRRRVTSRAMTLSIGPGMEIVLSQFTLPNLRHLTLRKTKFQANHSFPLLESLTVDHASFESIKLLSTTSLTTLTIADIQLNDADSIRAVLQELPNLQLKTLALNGTLTLDDAMAILELVPQVQELTFTNTSRSHFTEPDLRWTQLLWLITPTLVPDLRNVMLDLHWCRKGSDLVACKEVANEAFGARPLLATVSFKWWDAESRFTSNVRSS